MVYNANELYPHKAHISNEFNSSALSNLGILACHGYSFEEFSEAFDMYPFIDGANSLGSGKTFSLYRRLATDLFSWKNYYYKKPKFELN